MKQFGLRQFSPRQFTLQQFHVAPPVQAATGLPGAVYSGRRNRKWPVKKRKPDDQQLRLALVMPLILRGRHRS